MSLAVVYILYLNFNKYFNPLENCFSRIINRAHIESWAGPQCWAGWGMFGLHFRGTTVAGLLRACVEVGVGVGMEELQLNWLSFGEVRWDWCGNRRFWVTHKQVK